MIGKFWFHQNFEYINTIVSKNWNVCYFKYKNKIFGKILHFEVIWPKLKWSLSDFFWNYSQIKDAKTHILKNK